MEEIVLQHLHKLKRNWRLGIAFRSVLLSITLYFFVQTLNELFWVDQLWIQLAGGISALALLIGRFIQKDFFGKGYAEIFRYLNQQYPSFEHSAELLISDTDSVLERLQKDKVEAYFMENKAFIRLPFRFRISMLSLGLFVMVMGASFTLKPLAEVPSFEKETWINSSVTAKDFPQLEGIEINVLPPSYTKLSTTKDTNGNLNILEGSQVTWNAKFSSLPQKVQLVFDQKEQLPFRQNGDFFQGEKRMYAPSVYQLKYENDSIVQTSRNFLIQVKADEKPKVTLLGLEAFTQVDYQSNFELELQAKASDDFGIVEAKLMLTLSRGEGESVKFREVPLPLEGFRKGDKDQKLSSILNFDALKAETGDELYLQFWAKDNKPKGQWAKTDVYIISIKDPNKEQLTFQGGLAVDVMPEYFRSQRQIIIDTKKLIAEKASLSDQEFKERSNSIAADQKILRLRYGKFLGEEAVTVIGPMDEGDGHDKHEGKVTEKGHEHETPEEHAAHFGRKYHDHSAHATDDKEKVTEKGHEHETPEEHAAHAGHDHPGHPGHEEEIGADEKEFGEVGAEIEPYFHNHDHSDVSTFFDNALKSLLKAALAQMWDAELQLRLATPKKAIPFEEKALEYIKEIQKRSRIYVERVGFSPPPLKVAEKRLSGELYELKSRSSTQKAVSKQAKSVLADGVLLLQSEHWKNVGFSADEIILLRQVGNELSEKLLTESPSKLTSLDPLLSLIEENGLSKHQKLDTEKVLETIIQTMESATKAPTKLRGKESKLLEAYYKQL
ncbi:DUF4175 family protein [Sediminitomix flava]|uniref:DUF4175 family protein n=1 Tax=Sediminitomix flava TaxID=379075 RepID=A0A315ZDL1_SEDFL|nr:DUF4175 family protein [Sediminitomix flava]PWJ42948.1 hypothetical protein BC781_102495 [Sediminitomix flava]